MNEPLDTCLFLLRPQYQQRVWGGQKLQQASPPVGEAWIAYERSEIQGGEHDGQTVGELAGRYGAALLGTDVARRFGGRFPLLIKLLDCADWLSVQVHPNDEQARRLVGPGEFGKTEAWHFLEVDEGATILAGVKSGTSPQELARAIRSGRVLDVAERASVRSGETVFIPAGTLHALGPGMLLYEVQQVSDTTYRVYDWDRPASAGRALHLDESVEVTNPALRADVTPPPVLRGTGEQQAVSCPFFQLDVLQLEGTALRGETAGQSAHVITVTAGQVEVFCADQTVTLSPHQTLLVAAQTSGYEVRPVSGNARALRASVPMVG
ncbi:type I phosphomannose isomerase catalytic subunit [Deinococcus peraridilitoris]|uniref:Phosphomannose isomerase n=1 Tax=Deinococcus peraridilitoris (strain DSM 19664 / LMG 22246 / CIP 109416 / KR-200) TaxID=937777 RepID=L0A1C8_DEIPD|nr:type I phosphomannose isomerase catalytic subunit [Deinococcus peraridilitoris]AFZ67621.1 phosphomannose isomerase [Deinococcus peraridilitoris DSM 19664]